MVRNSQRVNRRVDPDHFFIDENDDHNPFLGIKRTRLAIYDRICDLKERIEENPRASEDEKWEIHFRWKDALIKLRKVIFKYEAFQLKLITARRGKDYVRNRPNLRSLYRDIVGKPSE